MGWPFEITIEAVWDLFLAQNRKCALSGLPLKFGSGNKGNASLDRIDSTKGYTLGNVQWVDKDVNKMKMDLSQPYFIELCRRISALGTRIPPQ